MAFPFAAQPDIVRAHQKDESYRAQLQDSTQDATRRVLGPRTALLYSREIELVSDLLYFLTTVGAGQQTPGEEYCDILQVSGKHRLAPRLSRRTALALIQACGPYITEHVQQYCGSTPQDEGNEDSVRTRFARAGSIALASLPWLMRLHLALFYFYGIFYQLPHRLTGVQYLFHGRIFEQRPSYRILGVFMFAQLGVSAASWLSRTSSRIEGSATKQSEASPAAEYSIVKTGQKATVIKDARSIPHVDPERSKYRCPLCLSPRTVPTATPCGHVFCWSCIAEWANQKPECPLCRSEVLGSDLICIHHADY